MRRRDKPTLVESPVGLAELARFDPRRWMSDDDRGDWVQRWVDARGRWSAARRAWAAEHGYDVHAPYGTKPGADWWAFVELCQQHDGGA